MLKIKVSKHYLQDLPALPHIHFALTCKNNAFSQQINYFSSKIFKRYQLICQISLIAEKWLYCQGLCLIVRLSVVMRCMYCWIIACIWRVMPWSVSRGIVCSTLLLNVESVRNL